MRLTSLWGYLWASPWTLAGALMGLLCLLSGGRARIISGVAEFSGGVTGWGLRHLGPGFSALTLGHVIIGQNIDCLTRCRAHELVHVRQYERWGILFVPCYLLSSLGLWVVGKRPYLDNPFEIEAYRNSKT